MPTHSLQYANCKPAAIRNLEVAEPTALRVITRMRQPNNVLHNPPNQLLYSTTRMEPIKKRISRLNKKFNLKLAKLGKVLTPQYHENENISTRKYPTQTLTRSLNRA